MATIRDTYGHVLNRMDANHYRDKYGEWVYALIDGGSLYDTRIVDISGKMVAEIIGGRIINTSGDCVGEFRGNKFYDTGGNWLFTID